MISNRGPILHVSGFLDRTLLFSVCQLPVLEFTELSISISIDCWHWLIANRPDLEYRVKDHHSSGIADLTTLIPIVKDVVQRFYLFVRSFVRPFVRSFVCSFVHLVRSFIHHSIKFQYQIRNFSCMCFVISRM